MRRISDSKSSALSKDLYTDANRRYATSSKARSGSRMASPISFAWTWELPWLRMLSSTSWAKSFNASSETSRPWQARRTPVITLSRLNGSESPFRLITVKIAFSTVVKRPVQEVHSRRRRMDAPESMIRESITREESLWQKGQCTGSWPIYNRGARIIVGQPTPQILQPGAFWLVFSSLPPPCLLAGVQ